MKTRNLIRSIIILGRTGNTLSEKIKHNNPKKQFCTFQLIFTQQYIDSVKKQPK
jgi:hypothetical protein